ncbi:MAG: cell division protein SepF [Actinomycetota bacterium]|nr:cell division protein SepF [Actinomycetota bacterium]
MAGLWQKTLFYLGLVDDESVASVEASQPQAEGGVRTVDPPGSRTRRRAAAAEPTGATTREPDPIGSASSRPHTTIAGRRVEPPSAQRRRVSINPEHAEAGVLVRSGDNFAVRTATADAAETEVIEARTFTDAQVLADHIRDGVPVVLDLRATEPAMVRRLVDFATGLTYALDGRMAKIAQGVILVSPAGRVIGVEEQERLRSLGLYRLDH